LARTAEYIISDVQPKHRTLENATRTAQYEVKADGMARYVYRLVATVVATDPKVVMVNGDTASEK
jgi:hypothetical protein